MKLKVLILFLALLLDRTIGPWSLVLPLMVVMLALSEESLGLKLALIVGIVLDLFVGRILGLSSLLFLLIMLQIKIFKMRIPVTSWWSMILLGVISIVEANIVWGTDWGLAQIAVELGLVIIFWLTDLWWLRWSESGELYLKS